MVTPWRRLRIVIGTPAVVPVHFIRTLEFSFIARTVISPSRFAAETPVVESEDDTEPPDTPTMQAAFPITTRNGSDPYPLTASGRTKLIAVCELSAVYVYLRR